MLCNALHMIPMKCFKVPEGVEAMQCTSNPNKGTKFNWKYSYKIFTRESLWTRVGSHSRSILRIAILCLWSRISRSYYYGYRIIC